MCYCIDDRHNIDTKIKLPDVILRLKVKASHNLENVMILEGVCRHGSGSSGG